MLLSKSYFKKPIKVLPRLILSFLCLYSLICIGLYFYQENLIFYPQKLPADYRFQFSQPFQEIPITTKDGTVLSGLLFPANTSPSKGLIFYLHGNAGSLQGWGDVAKIYTQHGYDVFLLDYRGYGKSGGEITSQQQLFSDNQTAFEQVKSRYQPSQKILILGYSVGTGMASQLACGTEKAKNHADLLILQAPYDSLKDMMRQKFAFVPTFLLKYQFDTHQYLQGCTTPVAIFHGDNDEIIPYSSSLKLQQTFKPADKLITLQNQGHNGITYNSTYQAELTELLK